MVKQEQQQQQQSKKKQDQNEAARQEEAAKVAADSSSKTAARAEEAAKAARSRSSRQAAAAKAAAAGAAAAKDEEFLKNKEENRQAIKRITEDIRNKNQEISQLQNNIEITDVDYNAIRSKKLQEKIKLYQTKIDLLRSSEKYGEPKYILDQKIEDIQRYIDKTQKELEDKTTTNVTPSVVKDIFVLPDESGQRKSENIASGGSIDNLIEDAFSDDLINMAFNQDNM